jgi:hypothetical protein
MTFVPHVLELLRLPGFRASIRFADTVLQADDRTSLAERARAEIGSAFVPHPS